MPKATQKQFKIFQHECSRWLDFFGLYEWRIDFQFDDDPDSDSAGWCQADMENKVATIALSVYWPGPIEQAFIKSTARHEVLELLVWPMYSAACRRFTTMDEIHAGRHGVIRRLESALDRLE